ncbi:heterocyst differentiation protein [Nostoc linckia z18]|uniref:Heterocyst differentiation protein n=3 Tax=Nostoc linckia TaxID=92942 RepID=A0A9Q5Z547_NOSLI|nr:cell division protein HetF [Nostoc linckia]PHK30188.1 heterocyst differentiation protein [Nostoc linckia z15]PHK46015.1 heterocyst differentiation protein [Nostoc linckia z16]PHJ57589.1 heterocyst differentiation protein [Nostoc linckia z3]PHJ59003.1 heterocyst differentiation protein [Nostoc linckia z2]PHJ59801.1 heterocyst differentiation protein [Nostoc linckia z1]
MTQEFHISVTPVGQNDYLVRTEQVAPGVPLAEELVTWPVADWLMAAGHLMNDPLKSVLQGDPFASSGRESDIARNSVNLVALGQQLYNALFQGTLRDSWITAQGIAQNHQQVLRLRLGLKDTRLARLPWEVMHANDRPLATGPYVAFSRFQSGILGASRLRSMRGATPTPNTFTPMEETGVKVLMVIASPLDQVRLDLLKQEAIKLQAELARPAPRFAEVSSHLPEIELTVLDQPGREELTQALEQGRYDVLHYSGHSNLGSNGGEIYLASRRTGLTEILTGDDLAGLLVNNNIQMAVFNSCLGAYTAALGASEDTGERNLAESLVKRGIASVLAMSERIPDEVALTLTQLFYRNLSQGYPVDLCVSRVRQGLISAYGSHQMYWALPILYLQPEFDGFLSHETTLSQSPEALNQYGSPVGTIPSSMYAAMAEEPEMPLGIEEMIPTDLGRDTTGLDWLGEDTWGDLVDEIEYDDPSYAEDSAIVSDLFRRLDEQKSSTEMEQQINENSLPNRPVSEEMTSSLEEADLWGEVPAPPTEPVGKSERSWQNSEFSRPSYPTPSLSRNRNRWRKLWPIVGIVGISAIAIAIGLNWWLNRPQANVSKIPPIPTEPLPIEKQPNIDLETAPTGIVTATATEKLSQGDLRGGLFAVEELLNRGAFAAAETALKLVTNQQVNDPSVNFLKGRLAWQSIQTGDANYSVDDVRRYWETAAKAKPDSLLYNNALGFAYYAERNLNRANDSWFKALNLALKAQNTTNGTTSTKTPLPEDALTSYAGLALGLYKSALDESSAKQAQYMNEAIKLRQMVMKSDGVNFQVDKLAKNWLWTEQAIKDWRSLLQEKSREE